MATLILKLKTEKRKVEAKPGQSTYTRFYIGITDAPVSEYQVKALAAASTPDHVSMGMAHPDDPAALVVSIDAEAETQGKTVWTFQVTFQTPPLSGQLPTDPLLRPPEISWGAYSEQRPIFTDYSTPPLLVLNSAQQRFDELPQREFIELTCTYIRNENKAGFDLARILAYQDRINKFAFNVDGFQIPPLVARLVVQEMPKQTEGAFVYYRVKYFFHFKKEGWNPLKILDIGYAELDGTGSLKPIVDKDGTEVRKPWPLDGAGHKRPNVTDTPASLPFNLYEALDFAPFNFQ